jgi:hypothetical protein
MKNRIRTLILDLLAKRDYLSFAEIDRSLIEGGMPQKGNVSATHGRDPNLVYWCNMSQDYLDAIAELVTEKALFLHSATEWTYFADGVMLDLPLAKRIPANGYKNEHWQPVCLRLVP